MNNLQETTGKREMLNIRIRSEERGLIDCAANLQGKNRTEFILEAARSAAEEAIIDQAVFLVGQKAYSKFLQRLEMPPSPNENLKKMLKTPAPWKRQ